MNLIEDFNLVERGVILITLPESCHLQETSSDGLPVRVVLWSFFDFSFDVVQVFNEIFVKSITELLESSTVISVGVLDMKIKNSSGENS